MQLARMRAHLRSPAEDVVRPTVCGRIVEGMKTVVKRIAFTLSCLIRLKVTQWIPYELQLRILRRLVWPPLAVLLLVVSAVLHVRRFVRELPVLQVVVTSTKISLALFLVFLGLQHSLQASWMQMNYMRSEALRLLPRQSSFSRALRRLPGAPGMLSRVNETSLPQSRDAWQLLQLLAATTLVSLIAVLWRRCQHQHHAPPPRLGPRPLRPPLTRLRTKTSLEDPVVHPHRRMLRECMKELFERRQCQE